MQSRSSSNEKLKSLFGKMEYNALDSVLQRFNKAYIGILENSSMTYNNQKLFNIDGYFIIKTTVLGANSCLLKEHGEGELNVLVSDGKEWLKQWF